MFKTTLKKTGLTLATVATLSIAAIGFTTGAQAASVKLGSTLNTAGFETVQIQTFGKKRLRSKSFRKSNFKRSRNIRSHKSFRHGSRSYAGRHHAHVFRKNRLPGFVLTPKSR